MDQTAGKADESMRLFREHLARYQKEMAELLEAAMIAGFDAGYSQGWDEGWKRGASRGQGRV